MKLSPCKNNKLGLSQVIKVEANHADAKIACEPTKPTDLERLMDKQAKDELHRQLWAIGWHGLGGCSDLANRLIGLGFEVCQIDRAWWVAL